MNSRQLGPILREQALSHAGRVSLSTLLESLVPVAKLRDLAREHGLSPKGFRIERAPAPTLASMLVQQDTPEVLEAACKILAETFFEDGSEDRSEVSPGSESAGAEDAEGEAPVPRPGEPAASPPDLRPLLSLRDQELREAREELAKSHEVNQGLRDRSDELSRQQQIDRGQQTRLNAELDSLRGQLDDSRSETPTVPRDQTTRIQSLEKDIDEQNQIEFQHRVKQAELAGTIRDLEERVEELEALVPKGRRRKRLAEAAPIAHRFTLPSFTSGFLKSMVGKDLRAVEAAYRSIFLYCTEGSMHPGLQVKALEATNLFSLRASLKHRVFFRPRTDGGIDILELLDRQEQETALRRHREKP